MAHIIAAIDLETTGLDVDRHEIIEIAIVPLNPDLTVSAVLPEFTARIRAEHSKTADADALKVNGLDPKEGKSKSEVAADFRQWLAECDIEKIYPLAHNLKFDMAFFCKAFPAEARVFSHHGRDSMYFALAVNDISLRDTGEAKFSSAALWVVKEALGLPTDNCHSAIEDAKDAACVYRKLMALLTLN